MEKNPISFLQEYMVKKHIMPSYTDIESKSGTHQNYFKIRVQCDQSSADGEGSSKKEAKTNAAKTMIQMLGINFSDLFASTDVSRIEDNIVTSNSSYINRLQEIAQKNGNSLPIYMVKPPYGPSHTPKFTTVCKFNGFEEEASASTKKDSKSLAAKKMFERINTANPIVLEMVEVESHNNPTATINDSTICVGTVGNNRSASNINDICRLQEIAQKNKSAIPVYTDKPSKGPPNAPTFTTVCKYAGYEEEASGITKKESKLLAAKKMFERISLDEDLIAADSLYLDMKVCANSQVPLNSYLQTVENGMIDLNIYEDKQNAMAKSVEKALNLFLPLSKTHATKKVNRQDKQYYNEYHTFLKDAFSDKIREHVMDKLQDLIRACDVYKNTNDSNRPMALLQQALRELDIQVKQVNYSMHDENSIFGLQLDTHPVISEIGHGNSKSNAVIHSVMQMATTICILIS